MEQLTRRCPACGLRFGESEVLWVPAKPTPHTGAQGPEARGPEATSLEAQCPVDRAALPPADVAAAELGSYLLLARLAEGGMGAVYRALHRKLGRQVAIKVLQRQLAPDRGIVNRFLHEARAANTIRHPNVVEVYDFVDSGPDIYFVMELLRGRDLHDAIHRPGGADPPKMPNETSRVSRPMDLDRAAHILEQIAAALHAAHARAIVHRDLKPENVFLIERDGDPDFVKLIDFGIAKLSRPDGRLTVSGAVLGTPEYMSPEQARGLPVDPRADVYALGCIAYEMLTGEQAFAGDDVGEIIARQISGRPPSLRARASSVPPAIEAVVLRALAKEPGQRHASARAFAEALRDALGQRLENPAAFDAPPADRVAGDGAPDVGAAARALSRVSRRLELLRNPPSSELREDEREGEGSSMDAELGATPGQSREDWLGPLTNGRGGLREPSAWRPLFAGAVLAGVIVAAAATARLDRTLDRSWTWALAFARSQGRFAWAPEAPAHRGAPLTAAAADATATAAAAAPVSVTLQSVPSGAALVDEQGRPLGQTPLTLVVTPGAARRVEFRKPGHRPVERAFVATADLTIAVELPTARSAAATVFPGRATRSAKAHSSVALDQRTTLNPFAATIP